MKRVAKIYFPIPATGLSILVKALEKVHPNKELLMETNPEGKSFYIVYKEDGD